MLAYARQLRYPRFWKDFFRTWLASIGAFALIVGLLAVFFPDFFIGNVLIVLIVVGGSGVAAIVLARPVIPFNEYVSDRAKIRLVVGDLFAPWSFGEPESGWPPKEEITGYCSPSPPTIRLRT